MEWPQQVEETLMPVAPEGLDKVFNTMCGSCSTEIAYKLAFMYKAKSLRGGADPSELDLSSCMKNQAPGSPNLAVMSFTGAFHGRMFASLTTTSSKAIHKVDVPGFDWPKAQAPQYKYPLEDHDEYNQKQDENSIKHVQELIAHWRDQKSMPVAAIVLEPILSEGGDIYISKNFAQMLRRLTTEHDIAFIVDEVQTGVGATGKYWAHQHWDIKPDMMTFAKKM